MPKITAEILVSLQETLDTAEIGYKLLCSDSSQQRRAGLRNLVVFGRAVTNVLQNLRSSEPTFDEWYQKYVGEMVSDEMMNFFYKLRSEILKEGTVKTKSGVCLNFSTDDIQRLPKPPHAKGLFICDNIGGSGWIVELPDGSTEKYYTTFPNEMASIKVEFPNSPKKHLGKEITDDSIQSLCRLYLDYLQRIVKEAKMQFSKK